MVNEKYLCDLCDLNICLFVVNMKKRDTTMKSRNFATPVIKNEICEKVNKGI